MLLLVLGTVSFVVILDKLSDYLTNTNYDSSSELSREKSLF